MAKITVEYLKYLDENFSYERMVELLNEKASEPEWIEINDRFPSKKEFNRSYKFLVSNNIDNWTDSAYWIPEIKGWNNGECQIYPTHWTFMPLPNKPN